MESDKISTVSTSNEDVAEIKLEPDGFNDSMFDASAQIENKCENSELLQTFDLFIGIISGSYY